MTKSGSEVRLVRLKDLLIESPQYGLTASSKEHGNILYLRISDITDDGQLKTDDLRFVDIDRTELEKFGLQKDDLLIARSGSVGRTFLVRELEKESVFASYLIRFKLDVRKVAPKYLFYYTLSPVFKTFVESKKKIVAQPNINAREFCEAEVPIFPVFIQEEIAAVLERVHRLKQIREYTNRITDKIVPALFLDMFGDPECNPMGWPTKTLMEIVLDIQPGFAFGKFNLKVGVPHLRPFNISRSGLLDLDEIKYIPEDKANENYLLRPGDLLFNNTNSEELVGKTALFNELLKATFSNHMTRLRFDNRLALPEYMWMLLNRLYLHGVFATMRKRWVNQAAIDTRQLKLLTIPTPPIEHQRDFASIVRKVESLRELQTQSSQEIKGLFNSLMQKAFSGQLFI